jgi:transposase
VLGAIPFYLPAYGPDLNPIEQLFAKLKALLRKIAAHSQEPRIHRRTPLQDRRLASRSNLPS